MSKLYGSVTNERGGKSTRAAHREVTATAQSWEGSVSVTITANHMITFRAQGGSTASPTRVLLECPLADLVEHGASLRVVLPVADR